MRKRIRNIETGSEGVGAASARCGLAAGIVAASLAILALSACNNGNKTQTVSATEPDPQAAALANRAPVELPPMITSEVTLRCNDDSLLHVTFFTGETQVMIKPAGQDKPMRLVADKSGDPYKAEGYSLSGTPAKVLLTLPGKPELTCKS